MSTHSYLTLQQSSQKDKLSVINNIISSKFPRSYLSDCVHDRNISMPTNDGRYLYQCIKCNTDIIIPMSNFYGDTMKIFTKHTLSYT